MYHVVTMLSTMSHVLNFSHFMRSKKDEEIQLL